MKLFKRVISMVSAISLLLTMFGQVYAADSSEVILNDLGLLQNITEAEMTATLTRDIGLVMILKSLGYTQADATQAEDNGYFTDVNDWAKGWAELAFVEGITTGVGEHIFGPKEMLSARDFVTFQLRALGHEGSDTWLNAVSLGRTSGLISSGDDLTDTNYTKREAATVMYNALTATIVGGSSTLVELLLDEGIVEQDKVEAYDLIDSNFELRSTSANNLKIITLSFTGSIDESRLNNETVYLTIDGDDVNYDSNYLDGVKARNYALHLVDDNTLDIVFGTPQDNNTSVKIELDNLLSVEGEKYTKTTYATMRDAGSPEALTAYAINPGYVIVEFDEPLQFGTGSREATEIEIDGDTFEAEISLSRDAKKIYLWLDDELREGDHELVTEGILDYAGKKSGKQTFELTVEDDNEDPYIVEAHAINREEVIIEFNEPFVTDKGRITIDDETYKFYDDDDEDYISIDGSTIKLTLKEGLSKSAATVGVDGEYEDFVDMVGNSKETDTTFTIFAPVDIEPPTVDVELDEDNYIMVTFSEPVQYFDTSLFVITEYDEDDDEDVAVGIGNVRAVGSSNILYKVTLSEPLVNEVTYDMVIMGVRDKSVYQNSIERTEVELSIADMLRPDVEDVMYLGDETIRILFTEPMNVDMLADEDYYIFHDESENKEYDLDDTDYSLEVDKDSEYVDITIEGLDDDDKIEVGRLEDTSGLLLKYYNKSYTFDSAADFDLGDLEALLIDSKTIELTAKNHEFGSIDEDDFLIRSGNQESEDFYIRDAYIDDDDESVAYLILSSSMDADAEVNGKKQYLYMNDDATTDDTYGQVLDITYTKPLRIHDGVKPSIEIDDDEEDTLILEFSEVVSADSNQEVVDDIYLYDDDGDLVELEVGDNITLGGGTRTYSFFDTVTITGLKGGYTYTVKVVSHNIYDGSDNRIEELDETVVTIEK